MNWYKPITLLVVCGTVASPASAQEKPVVGLIPKTQKPITMDGKLDDWAGAFVTPVHVGHPDFANRGGQFLFLWDEQNLIEKEMAWSRGGRPLYFRDPAGNSVELVTPGLWGLPSRW